jgi:hypothetical protein
MEWTVLDWNEPAIRFYESLGPGCSLPGGSCGSPGGTSPAWPPGPAETPVHDRERPFVAKVFLHTGDCFLAVRRPW